MNFGETSQMVKNMGLLKVCTDFLADGYSAIHGTRQIRSLEYQNSVLIVSIWKRPFVRYTRLYLIMNETFLK